MKTKSDIRPLSCQMSSNSLCRRLIVFVVFLITSGLSGQETGCLQVICDADDISIYINGKFAGKTPLDVECGLNPSEHIIAFFPPVAGRKIRYLDRDTYLDILFRSSTLCDIVPGDTVTVNMDWQPVMLELAYLEKEYRRTRWTLIGVSGLVLLTAAGIWKAL